MNIKDFVEHTRQSYNSLSIPKIYFIHFIYDFFLIYCTRNFPHKKTNRIVSNLCKRFQLKGKRILDIGSGLGYNSFYFYSEKNNVTGIELSENYYRYSKTRYSIYNIEFIEGNVLERLCQIKDNSIDFIFCYNFPAHYDSNVLSESDFTELFFRAIHLKLKQSNGVFYYIFYSTIHRVVTVPISEFDLQNLMLKLNITKFDINIIDSDYPMLELVIKG